ncbi:MAG: hypothetical protein A2289_02160 [Deltaproteobacteria bacterium RIFOXYA12_FULL_58_15]|nr:MAG: hypothetical protein A2289_02160 [Deltaproteobacteria bacterium RIFOXYA12_FULL_58_15]OGR15170.1 MAG: hypothetical protein A2341_13905 [Deltaproteobacteria bacterium RIFOXYB12_FULL_58_9]
MPEITTTYNAEDRAAWRDWLEKYHDTKTEVWLVFFKKHLMKKNKCIDYNSAVEEALCFGWIDGVLKPIDGKRHAIRFSPRSAKSSWSELNKSRVRKLIRHGLMAEAGMALVREAKERGEWQRDSSLKKAMAPPHDLREALSTNPSAKANFAAFAPSHRAMYVSWILDAKRSDTRERRIVEVVARCAQNEKPGIR